MISKVFFFFSKLCESVSTILTKNGIHTQTIEPVYYYQMLDDLTCTPINYALVYYGDDYYANVTYKYTDGK